jgi:nucleotide-binding universal stress UspA family protein
MNTVLRVLFPLDGSDCAQKLLEWSLCILNPHTVELYLLNVAPIIPGEYSPVEEEMESGNVILANAKAFFEAHQFTIQSAHVQMATGNIASTICHYADENEIDQIMIASHGRTGLSHLIMGSVSQDLFKKAKQPVISFNVEPEPSIHISHFEKNRIIIPSVCVNTK